MIKTDPAKDGCRLGDELLSGEIPYGLREAHITIVFGRDYERKVGGQIAVT